MYSFIYYYIIIILKWQLYGFIFPLYITHTQKSIECVEYICICGALHGVMYALSHLRD